MFGIPIAFLAGYVVARWFGEYVKEVLHRTWTELHDWL